MIMIILGIIVFVGILLVIDNQRVKKRKEKEQNEENDRIEKQREEDEIQKIKKEEIKAKLEKLINSDIKDGLASFENILINFASINDALLNCLDKFDISVDEDKIYNALTEIYRLNILSNGIQDFKKLAKENAYLIITNKLYINIDVGINDVIELYSNKNVEDILIYELLTGNLIVITQLINDLIDFSKKNFYNNEELEVERISLKRRAVLYSYYYVVALVKIIILSKEKHKIEINTEFYKIQKNLHCEFGMDIDKIGEKLYPIYNEFYKKISFDIYSETELKTMIYLLNKEEKENIGLVQTFVEGINAGVEVYPSLKTEVDTNIINDFSDNITYESINEIIKGAVTFDLYNLDNDNMIQLIYSEIIYEMKDKLSGKQIFELYQKSYTIINDINNVIERKKLIKDKQRFLYGDFSREKKIENEKLKFDSIITGIEFEEYLKHIFERMGYKVELTKTTGDQGADLIITKGNLKTVVQAKFYSSPVGNKAVQEVVSAIKFYNADNGMVVTNNCYTKSAIELADVNNIVLWDGDVLKGNVEQLMVSI